MIDDQVLMVREFGLFATTFRRVDGQEVIAPNSLLASSKLVHNLRRSHSMFVFLVLRCTSLIWLVCRWETTNLMVSYDTPLEVLEGEGNSVYVDTVTVLTRRGRTASAHERLRRCE